MKIFISAFNAFMMPLAISNAIEADGGTSTLTLLGLHMGLCVFFGLLAIIDAIKQK